MESLLLTPDDVLRSLGFDPLLTGIWEELLARDLPVIHFLGPDHPRVRPEDLRSWFESRLHRIARGQL